MDNVKMSYESLMRNLASGQFEKAKYVMELEDGSVEVLTVMLDSRGVLCFAHNGQLEDLPIDYYMLFSEDRYFEVEV